MEAAAVNADSEYRLLPLFPFDQESHELSQNELSESLPAYATYLEEETFFENLSKCVRRVTAMFEKHKFSQKSQNNDSQQ